MKIGILNSGGYNINSIKFALNRLGVSDVFLVKQPQELEICDKIIIPGVGHAKNAMKMLESQNLLDGICNFTKPVLGICLGMQIMFENSAEGNVNCLGIIPGKIEKIPDGITSPQMGWNRLINGKYAGNFVYFANSFYAKVAENTTSFVSYNRLEISAIVQYKNFIGCQFHPEKSGKVGEEILSDFLHI